MFLSLLWERSFFRLACFFFWGGGEGGSLTETLKVWQQQLGDEDMGESRRNGEEQRLVGWYLKLRAVGGSKVGWWLVEEQNPVIARGSEQRVARHSMYFRTKWGAFLELTVHLGGGFKYFVFSPLFGDYSHFDEHIFQRGWFNHQLVILKITGSQECWSMMLHKCWDYLLFQGFIFRFHVSFGGVVGRRSFPIGAWWLFRGKLAVKLQGGSGWAFDS